MYVNAFCSITIKITVNNQELEEKTAKYLGKSKMKSRAGIFKSRLLRAYEITNDFLVYFGHCKYNGSRLPIDGLITNIFWSHSQNESRI